MSLITLLMSGVAEGSASCEVGPTRSLELRGIVPRCNLHLRQ